MLVIFNAEECVSDFFAIGESEGEGEEDEGFEALFSLF